MAHVDSVYNFGKRITPIYTVLRKIINEMLFLDEECKHPILPRIRNLRVRGERPNLEERLLEVVEESSSSRLNSLFEKTELLNLNLVKQIDQLKGKDIIFTDPISPSEMDPQFLFSNLIDMGIEFPKDAPKHYGIGYPTRVWHDIYSPMFAQSDAILLMAKKNPGIWRKKIIWPVSFVAFPSIITEDPELALQYFDTSIFDEIDARMISYVETRNGTEQRRKIGLGSRRKSISDIILHLNESCEGNFSKVGTLEVNPSSFFHKSLLDLSIKDPMAFETRINKIIEKYELSWERALDYLRAELPFETALKHYLTALFYVDIINRLDLKEVVLFAPKISVSYDVLTTAIKILNKNQAKESGKLPQELKKIRQNQGLIQQYKLTLIGPANSGPIDTSKKSRYRELHSSALERLNGYVLNMDLSGSEGKKELIALPSIVRPKLDRKELYQAKPKFEPCILGVPAYCESVYSEAHSCAMQDQGVKCSYHVFERFKNPNFMEDGWLGQKWLRDYNSKNAMPEVRDYGELFIRNCRDKGYIPYPIEIAVYLLNRGSDLEVFASSTHIDRFIDQLPAGEKKELEIILQSKGIALDTGDKRRTKAKLNWWKDKGDDILFPFPHPDEKVENPFNRISNMALRCHLAKQISMYIDVLPPETFASAAAVNGTLAHMMTNGIVNDPVKTGREALVHEMLWQELGIPVIPREQYTEKEIKLVWNGNVLRGHSDCVLIKAPQYLGREELTGKTVDLVVVDLKTSSKPYTPGLKYLRQIGSYLISIEQMNPEINFRNFYSIIINRRLSSDANAVFPLPQVFTIIKMENKPDDVFLSYVKSALTISLETQNRLLSDREYLHDYKAEMLRSGACMIPLNRNYSRTGCYNDQREKCNCMFSNIGEKTLMEYMNQFRK